MILVPKFKHLVELGGTLSLAQYRDGELIDTRFNSNLVTVAGKKWIAARLRDASRPDQMTHMAIGGSTTPGALSTTSITDAATTLTTQGVYAQRARVAFASPSAPGGKVDQGTTLISYNATFATTDAANTAIVEAGIFNAASGTYSDATHLNCMLCITTFNVVNKGANDTIAITWTVSIA